MKILLKKLIIKNFKGIKTLEINFDETETKIEGKNRAGKTTVFDAFTWLLFGKDSTDRKDFEIKPLDKNNNIISKLENKVTGLLEIDGKDLKLSRMQKEIWQKPHGSESVIFKGNETKLEWNDVPVKVSEFSQRLKSVIDENFFKLLANPLFFNTLKWEKRREMLLKLVPDISDYDIAKKVNSKELTELLNREKSITDIKKEVAAKIKKTKEVLKTLPIRIDEVNTGIPEVLNFLQIGETLKSNGEKIIGIQKSIIDKSKVLSDFNELKLKEKTVLQERKSKIEIYKTNFNYDFEQKQSAKRFKKSKKNSEIKNKKYQVSSLENEIKEHKEKQISKQAEKESKITEWHEISGMQFEFNKEKSICPTCKQSLPENDILKQTEKLENNFNKDKAEQLSVIENYGAKLNKNLEYLKTQILEKDAKIADLKKELETLEKGNASLRKITAPDISKDLTYKNMQNDYDIAEKLYKEETPPTVNVSELEINKKNIANENIELRKKLNVKEEINKAKKRISELEKEEKEKATILLSLEKLEFAVQKFTKLKITEVEKQINDKFQFVKFKMFEMQINGQEKETCKTLISGVPFADANTEGRLNAGLDIINTFSKYYQIAAPVFLDNRESVTEIIETDAQIINLIVNKEYDKLKIS